MFDDSEYNFYDALAMALAWVQLPEPARLALLDAKFGVPLSVAILQGTTVRDLVNKRFVIEQKNSGSLMPTQTLLSLVKLARGLAPSYAAQRTCEMLGSHALNHSLVPTLFQRALKRKPLEVAELILDQCFAGGSWVQQFIDLDDLDWRDSHYSALDEFGDFRPKNRADLRTLLLQLGHGPWSIADAARWITSPQLLVSALSEGCCAVILLPSWNAREGLMFEAAQAFDAPIAGEPVQCDLPLKPCVVRDSSPHGALAHNLREILLFVFDAPQKMHKEEQRLYQKTVQLLLPRLATFPPWFELAFHDFHKSINQVSQTIHFGIELKLLEVHRQRSGTNFDSDDHLRTTELGKKFLLEDWDGQIKMLRNLSWVKGVKRELPFASRFTWVVNQSATNGEVMAWIAVFASFLAELPQGEFFHFRSLVKAWIPRSPVRAWYETKSHRNEKSPKQIEQGIYDIEFALLKQIGYRAYFAGAIHLGVDNFGRIALSTTPLTQWFLANQGELVLDAIERASIILKPDYEIVFLKPSMSAEARLAPFCNREGPASVGLLFKVNKASIQRAGRLGMSIEQIENALQECCATMPQNVLAEIRGWHSRVSSVRIESAELLMCPSEEIAQIVLSQFPRKVSQLQGTILRVNAGLTRKVIRETLLKEGIELQ